MSKKISPEEYWKWDKFEGETSAEDMREDFKRYVKEHYGKDIEFVESDNPDTFKALFLTQHKKYDISKVKMITLNGKKYINMSVIEDIKAEINTMRNRNITLFKADGLTKQELTFSDSAYVEVLETIDKAVREVEK